MDSGNFADSFENSPTSILISDVSGKIISWNKSALSLFEKIDIQTNISSFLSNEIIPELLKSSKAVQLALDNGAELEKLKSASGNFFYASVFKSTDEQKNQTLFIRDINKQIDYILKVKEHRHVEYELSKSSQLGSGNLTDALQEIAVMSAQTMDVTRMNIWEIDGEFSSIRSIVNYDKRQNGFQENMTLYRQQFPNYFSLMQTAEIIPTSDALNNLQTQEIKDGYLIPMGIKSLIDIPIRLEGKMIGVVCFEDTEKMREWNISEQNFAASIAQIIAQTLETNRRQIIQADLEKALSEKKLLLAEINQRVKNNFALIGDLLRLQEAKATDEFHKQLFEEIRTRLLSMAMIHRQLYLSDTLGAVNFRDFLLDLAAHFRTTYSSEKINISTLLDNCRLPIGKAVLGGLVVNELLTHSCSDAFSKGANELITLKMSAINENVNITVSNSGSKNTENSNGISNELVNKLVEQLKGSVEHPNNDGASTTLSFSIQS